LGQDLVVAKKNQHLTFDYKEDEIDAGFGMDPSFSRPLRRKLRVSEMDL
jgi:hypothetical protein